MAEPEIRISNAERDAAVSALGEHLSTGRLDLSEYEERCGQAAGARTRGEIEVLFEDLPAPHPDLSSATRPGQLIQKTGQLVSKSTGLTKKDDRRSTPASRAFETIAGLLATVGIPAAILLTIFLGAWWMFIVVPVGCMVAGGLSDAFKRRPST